MTSTVSNLFLNLVYKSSTLNKALIPRILKLIIFFNISEYPVDNNDYNEISLTITIFFKIKLTPNKRFTKIRNFDRN